MNGSCKLPFCSPDQGLCFSPNFFIIFILLSQPKKLRRLPYLTCLVSQSSSTSTTCSGPTTTRLTWVWGSTTQVWRFMGGNMLMVSTNSVGSVICQVILYQAGIRSLSLGFSTFVPEKLRSWGNSSGTNSPSTWGTRTSRSRRWRRSWSSWARSTGGTDTTWWTGTAITSLELLVRYLLEGNDQQTTWSWKKL